MLAIVTGLSNLSYHRSHDGCIVTKIPPEVADLLAFRRGSRGPSPAEGLLLLKAFMRIKNSSLRQTIVELVEKIAAADSKR